MAEKHHHSGFDQEGFERYDTFDAPVSDQTNPDREGLGGDIGRLIDEIKIANAANKLDKDVSLGEDRVLNDSGNWAAVPHKQLYESVHTNNDPAEAYALAREWTDLGNMMADNSRAMDEAIRSTESGWSGVAASSARESTLKLATWGGDAAQTSQYMGTRIAEQGLAAERAKAAMPEPVEFNYDQMLRQGFASGGLAGLARAVQDVQVASEQARNAHDQAVQVMSEMERQSKSVDETTPRFVRPPDATATDGAAMQGLMMPRGQEVPVTPTTPVEPFANATPRSTGSQPGFGNGAVAASGGGYSGGESGYQPPAVASSGSYTGAQTYVPPNIPVPEVPTGGPYMGTSAQGYTPPPMPQIPNSPTYQGPGYTGTPFPQGGYNPGDTIYNGNPYNPNSGYNPGNGQMPPGSQYPPRGGGQMPPGPGYNPGSYRPPNAPEGYRPPGMPPGINPVTGEPYPPGQGPRPGVPPFTGGSGAPGGGGGGGFGPRGGMPGGGGLAGFGETGGVRSGPPTGAAVGGLAAEEAAAMRGQGQNPALAGRPGAAGSPGMGGMGAHGAKGGEDQEHRSKYATGEKVVEEPGRMVPLVIGEKTARQRKEEQPPQ